MKDYFEAIELARNAYGPLQEIRDIYSRNVAEIQVNRPSKNKRPADDIGFVRDISRELVRYIGQPTRNQLITITELVFEAINVKYPESKLPTDVRRHVEAALKNL